MTTEQLAQLHERMCEKARSLMLRKNHDYAGLKKTFANFERVKAMDICEVDTGFFVRMCDKFSRLISLAQTGEAHVTDESVFDTLVDMINYPILYAGWLTEKNERKNEQLPRTTEGNHVKRGRARRSKREYAGIIRAATALGPARRLPNRNHKGTEG